MDSITFSNNWNHKLDCNMYTTLRINSSKYTVGQQYNILLRGKFQHQAICVEARLIKFDQLNRFIIGLDMGLSVSKGKEILQKMYKYKDLSQETFVLILLQKIISDVNQPTPESLVD